MLKLTSMNLVYNTTYIMTFQVWKTKQFTHKHIHGEDPSETRHLNHKMVTKHVYFKTKSIHSENHKNSYKIQYHL
ncbi:hypothetical protein Hanom_Chr05g00395581 [Helianthus anomalus]